MQPRRLLRPLAIALVASTLALAPASGPATAQETNAEELIRQGKELAYTPNAGPEVLQQGLDLLEQAAAAGSTDALLELGSLHLYGIAMPKDWARARSYFDRAAEAGDWSGLAQYGAMLVWAERDWSAGEKLLVQAGENGVGSAWATLAEAAMYGYLGGGAYSRAKYEAYAEKAALADQEQAAILEASRYMWGVSVRADGPKAVEVLTKAADAGNKTAARYLIGLLRDGNGQNVRRNRPAARAALDKYRPLLTEVEIWQSERSIDAAEAKDPQAYEAVVSAILAEPDLMTREFARDLLKANQNVAFYLLQVRLAVLGFDAGAPDGYVGPRTLAAMNAACPRVQPQAECADSVMQPEVIAALLTLR